MKVICLDTQILIWGIKKEASPGQEDMVFKARNLVRILEEERAQVIVPALVLAELLMPIEENEYGNFLSKVSKKFMIVPFDTKAAFCYANLWKTWRAQNVRKLKKDNHPTRAKMKTDFMIVATAISRKAECIYSHDADIMKFAKGHIEVRDLPPVFFQGRIID